MLYVRWTYFSASDARATVFPDGCRDLLVVARRGVVQEVLLTDWDTRPQQVRISAGTTLKGYRLRPGVSISPSSIRRFSGDEGDFDRLIASEAARNEELEQIVDALAGPSSSVDEVARGAGVSPRTLQRKLNDLKLPIPEFWRLLGRARRAALALPCRVSLAEIAVAFGYSDQAHMTREFVRWFGETPAQLRRNRSALDELFQPGLGNWTGEQISIR